jgi:hypothetical protein
MYDLLFQFSITYYNLNNSCPTFCYFSVFHVGDKRLLALGLEQMTSKYGAAQDSIGVLKYAFDKLKKEAGKPANFMYPEVELEQEMYGENARLQSQLLEAEDQIGTLELENTRVRKAMKNQAGMIGEQGFKFQGMSSDMLLQVNEFATNLREGKVDLPLNDRSAELLKENKRLKDEEKAMKLRIERYEREISGSIGINPMGLELGPGSAGMDSGAGLSKVQEAELHGLRNDVQKLLNENNSIHNSMIIMQEEFMQAMKSKIDEQSAAQALAQEQGAVAGQGQGQDGLASALLVANESLMKQLIEAREVAQQSAPALNSSNTAGNMTSTPRTQESRAPGVGAVFQANEGPFVGGKSNARLPPAGGRKPSFLGTPRGLAYPDNFTPGTYMPVILLHVRYSTLGSSVSYGVMWFMSYNSQNGIRL